MVTAQGYYVLDTQGNRIRLSQNLSQLTVSAQGVISQDGNEVAALRIVDFVNKGGLSAQGDGCYIETEVSGVASPSQARVIQGALENSNVDLAVELTQLIRAQRGFSLAGKAVSMWDQMAGTDNNLRV